MFIKLKQIIIIYNNMGYILIRLEKNNNKIVELAKFINFNSVYQIAQYLFNTDEGIILVKNLFLSNLIVDNEIIINKSINLFRPDIFYSSINDYINYFISLYKENLDFFIDDINSTWKDGDEYGYGFVEIEDENYGDEIDLYKFINVYFKVVPTSFVIKKPSFLSYYPYSRYIKKIFG